MEERRWSKSFLNLNPKIYLNTLAYFSIHLIENRYDVSSVQSLLGHKSPETTMIYLHMASPNMVNVKSPLDSLDFDLQLDNECEKFDYEFENNKAIRVVDGDNKDLSI